MLPNRRRTSHGPHAPKQFGTGARVAIIGDSIIQYGNSSFNYTPVMSNQSVGEFTESLFSNPCFRYDNWYAGIDLISGYAQLTVQSSSISGSTTTLNFTSTTGPCPYIQSGTYTVATGNLVACFATPSLIPYFTSVSSVTTTSIVINAALTIPNGTILQVGGGVRNWYGANHGIAGQTSPQSLARVQALVDAKYDIVFVCIGTNDGGNPLIYGSIIISIVERLIAGGALVILTSIRPAFASTVKTDRPTQNDLLLAYAAGRKNCMPLDLASAYAAYNAYGDSAEYADGLHPSNLGAYRAATKAIVPLLQSLITPGNFLLIRYWNTGTNLLSSGSLTGSAGTTGTNVSGSVPTNWKIWGGSGTFNSTATASLTTNPDTGGQLVGLSIHPTVGAASETLYFTNTNTIAINPNSWVMGFVEIDLDTCNGARPCTLTVTDNATKIGNVSAASDCGEYTGTAGTRKVWLQTPPLRTGSNATGLTFTVALGILTAPSTSAATNAAQPNANTISLTYNIAGISVGMVATGTGITGSAKVVGVTPINGGGYTSTLVELDGTVSVSSGTTITFTTPTTTTTPKIRRAWLGYCDNPLIINNSVQT